jgi:hypothetical protein
MDGPKLLRDFRNFGKFTLLHVQSTKTHAPCFDQMTIDPLRCDPMVTITPPPELPTSYDLEEFCGCSKASTFVPPMSPTILGLTFSLENIISYDLSDSLRPTIPKDSVTPWIS